MDIQHALVKFNQKNPLGNEQEAQKGKENKYFRTESKSFDEY